MNGEKIACRTPARGRDGVTNIPKWKFDAMRRAIYNVLADGEVEFRALPDLVKSQLSDEECAAFGSINWHLTTVKLELEVRGEVLRLPGRPQKIILANS